MQGELSVSVDRDFARFGNKSYAINKINSVEVRARYPHSGTTTFVFGLLAIICFISSLSGGGISVFAFAVLFGLLTFWAWRRSKIVEYQLFLMTSSSEAQAISSFDGGMIEGLRNRIEQAMTGRLAA